MSTSLLDARLWITEVLPIWLCVRAALRLLGFVPIDRIYILTQIVFLLAYWWCANVLASVPVGARMFVAIILDAVATLFFIARRRKAVRIDKVNELLIKYSTSAFELAVVVLIITKLRT